MLTFGRAEFGDGIRLFRDDGCRAGRADPYGVLSDDLLHFTVCAVGDQACTGVIRCAGCARRSRWQRTGWG